MTYSIAAKNRIIAVGVGAIINLLMFFIKLFVGLSVNSVAIYTDAVNSFADCGVCIAAAIGFGLIGSGSTKNYPFGKGKGEDLLSLLISAVITVTGCAFAYVSAERLMYPAPVWYSSLYAVIIAATAAVKLLLAFFFKAFEKKHGSDVIKGISADSTLDFFITLCTLGSFTLSEKISFSVDGLAGLLISAILIIQGIKSAAGTVKKLIGKRDDKLCTAAKTLIEADSGVESVTDIQCHCYGEIKIFNAVINTNCETADEINRLLTRLDNTLQKEMNSALYISLGGKNEK